MNLISQVPLAICSLRKWCLISICLVLECMTGFLDKFIALVLSQLIGILFKRIPKSLSCCLSHNVWAQQLLAAMYFAYAVESATDRDQIREDFTNGGRGHSPKHLKFFLLVF